MPYPNSEAKDNQTIEVGDVRTGDEAELARMGYKQELKCVRFNLYMPLTFETYGT